LEIKSNVVQNVAHLID